MEIHKLHFKLKTEIQQFKSSIRKHMEKFIHAQKKITCLQLLNS